MDGLTTDLWVVQQTTDKNTEYSEDVTIYYDNTAYPTTTLTEVLTINYYDDYLDAPTGAPGSVVVWGSSPQENNATNVKGLATVSKIKVLDVSPAQWITTLTYYDKKSRPIYTYSENSYLGTVDIVESQLDFVGRPQQLRTVHTKDGTTIVTLDNYTYDHVGRLLKQTQCLGDESLGYTCTGGSGSDAVPNLVINNETVTTDRLASNSITVTNSTITNGTLSIVSNTGNAELIVYNSYDELGQLQAKKVGGVPGIDYASTAGLQTVDYTYNVRGWLKTINQDQNNDNDLFDFTLRYNDPTNGTALYNGNISQVVWDTQSQNVPVNGNYNDVSNTYTYGYDALNRIINAVDNTGHYNLDNIGYDKNGNIQRLERSGHTVENPDQEITGDFATMDDLVYDYHDNELSNRLYKVQDNSNVDFGFKDSPVDDQDYWYDANGNMIKDDNKGITDIEYNHLNLPTSVSIAGGTISYIYDAVGTKLKKTVGSTVTEYAGNYIYEGNITSTNLQFFNHPEGYVSPSAVEGQYNYIYQYKDHLGNIRLSYQDANGDGDIDVTNDPMTTEIVEENNYYPFGLEHKGYNNSINGVENNYFTYQSKELEESLGLDWHDFGARQYDASIGRWLSIDPLSDQTGYTYAAMNNNPIAMIDPTGMIADWVPKVNSDGSTSYIAEAGDSAATLSEQYGIDQGQAEEITGTTGDTEIAEGTAVSGEQVASVTGSDVLKLDVSSELATDQRVFDQYKFGNEYSNQQFEKGQRNTDGFYSNEFFGNIGDTHIQVWDGTATMDVGGQTVPVNFSIPLSYNDGGVYFGVKTRPFFLHNNSSRNSVITGASVFGDTERGVRNYFYPVSASFGNGEANLKRMLIETRIGIPGPKKKTPIRTPLKN